MGVQPTEPTSSFERIARAITVRDVYVPFAGEVRADESEGDFLKQLIDKRADFRLPYIVWGDDDQNGVYWPPQRTDQRPSSQANPIRDNIDAFYSDYLVSADTSLLDIIEELAVTQGDNPFLVVLDQRTLAGVVRYRDLLLTPAARSVFLALVLELETSALELCVHFADECLSSMSKGRFAKTFEMFERRYGKTIGAKGWIKVIRHPSYRSLSQPLLDCTTMADRRDMIAKCKLTGESPAYIKKVFGSAELLRNACAHPASINLDEHWLRPKEISQLIHDCHELIAVFRSTTPKGP